MGCLMSNSYEINRSFSNNYDDGRGSVSEYV